MHSLMSERPTVSNQIIRASAGTGKTYLLISRYLRLLFLTEKPQRIIALTFTRKAAGEFFEKIFNRLADAASSEESASKLGASLSLPFPVTQQHALRLLRTLIDNLATLQLSTYDSFFSRIVQAFPFDLGLLSTPTSIDERQQAEAIRHTHRALSQYMRHNENLMNEFWHAFKLSTMGQDTKSITSLLNSFIEKYHSLYLRVPIPERWGNPDSIWPDGCPWRCDFRKADIEECVRKFADLLSAYTLTPKQCWSWNKFLTGLLNWNPPSPPGKTVFQFVSKFLEVYDRLDSGQAVITVYKKQLLSAELGQVAKQITRLVFWNELRGKLESIQGVFRIIQIFESVYSREIRQLGLLTINDMTHLLAGNAVLPDGILSPLKRQFLDYKLNTSYDHWLLDEFQDTSHSQWLVIENLIDEILQDESGQRSFFAVGDTKQSLYMWRDSDDRLFDSLHQHYGRYLSMSTLSLSFRSTQPVLDMVNTIFNQINVLERLFGKSLAERWKKDWLEHHPAPSLEKQGGHAVLLRTPGDDENNQQTLLELLKALDPLPKGLSVAVLTRKNDEAEAIFNLLRREKIPSSLAADTRPGIDNAATSALVSLLTLASHPDDMLAWQHILMTPPGKTISEKYPSAAHLSAHLLDLASNQGLKAVVDYWIACCAPHIPDTDHFTSSRLEQCRNTAAMLDQKGGNTPDDFIDYLRTMTVRKHESPGQVAVMTIHKSKGLAWDIIILPCLEDRASLDSRRHQAIVQKNHLGEIEWILDTPPAELSSHDQVLGHSILQAREDAAFEKLCLLYVALTRARRGLYLMSKGVKPQGKSHNFPFLLESTLVSSPPVEITINSHVFQAVWQSGSADWMLELPSIPSEKPIEPKLPLLPPEKRKITARPNPFLPTDDAHHRHLSEQTSFLFSSKSVESGRDLHSLLEQIEWLPQNRESAHLLIDKILKNFPPHVADLGQKLLSSPETGKLFSIDTHTSTELWRETPFEVLHQNTWMSGRFDRVHIHRDSGKNIKLVELIDFKLTGIQDDAAIAKRYQPQMENYRKALCLLLGVQEEIIKMIIVKVSPPKIIPL